MFNKFINSIRTKFLHKRDLYENIFIIIIFLLLPFVFFNNSLLISKYFFGHGDAYYVVFPYREFLINSYKNLSLPLWNPYNFAGMPFLANIQTGSLYFINILLGLIFPKLVAYNLSIYIHYSLAGIFTYFFIKEYNISKLAAFSSGLAFMFSGFMIIRQVHPVFLFVLVWLPLILFFLEKYFKSKKIKFILIASIVFSIQLLAGNPQIFLYSSIIVFLYILFSAFLRTSDEKIGFALYKLNAFWIFIIGIILSSIQLLPTYELMKLGFRTKISFDDFSTLSFSLKQIPELFFPYIFGKVNPNQYSDIRTLYPLNYAEQLMYLGIFPFFLSIIGLFWKNKKKLFWGIISLISLIMVFGKNTPFYNIFYNIPLFNMFRYPTRHWGEFCFSMYILTGFGIEYILQTWYEKIKKVILIIVFLALIVLSGFFSIYFTFINKIKYGATKFLGFDTSELSKSFSITKSSIYIPLILIGIFIIVLIIVLFLKRIKSRKVNWIVIFIILLIFVDLFTFGHNYEPYTERDTSYILDQNNFPDHIKLIKSDSDISRSYFVFNEVLPYDKNDFEKNINGNINLFYNIYNIAGYEPFVLRDFKQITRLSLLGDNENSNYNDLISNNNILSVFNVKYIFIPTEIVNQNFLNSFFGENNDVKENLIKNDDIFNSIENTEYINKDLDSKSLVFKSGSDSLKLISIPVNIKSNKYYSLSFKAKLSNSNTVKNITDNLIHFDFYGEKDGIGVYDNPKQEYILDLNSLDSNFKEYKIYFDSGDVPINTNIAFRIFCWLTTDFELKDIHLAELQYSYNAKYNIIESIKPHTVLNNFNYLPRFYFAKNIINVKDINDVEKNLWDKNYDPKINTMVENYDLNINKYNNSELNKVEVLKYKTNFADLKVNMKEDGFLIFSDTFYPGWRAYIDGESTKIYKTNGLFKGIYISAGDHKIRFRFLPDSFIFGAIISILTFITLLIFLIISIKKEKNRPLDI